ncbi:MAG: substrate-binding domain-containing protein, partial [Chthoniobacterales bacterium]
MKRSGIYIGISPASRFARIVLRGITDYFSEKSLHFELDIPFNDSFKLQHPVKGIIAGARMPSDVHALLALKVPVVNISSFLISSKLPSVISDNEMGGRMAAEHLIKCRFHNFAYNGRRSGHSYTLRGKGFKETVEARGFSYSEYLHKQKAPVEKISPVQQQDLRRWLDKLPKPVGIFCGIDRDAWEIWSGCDALGLKIGKDVGIVGFGNDEFYCQTRRPYLSSVENRPDRIGYEAAALLLRLMRGARPPAAPLLIPPGGVVQRESASIFLTEDTHVDMAIQFIRDHLNDPKLMENIFKHVPMSRRTLERRFQ